VRPLPVGPLRPPAETTVPVLSPLAPGFVLPTAPWVKVARCYLKVSRVGLDGVGRKRLPSKGAASSVQEPVPYASTVVVAVRAGCSPPAWVISTLRGLAASTTGMVAVSTPFS
jgi:hypothetical protein